MHSRQNNKERQNYLQGLRLFSNSLPRGVKNILRKNGYNYSEIITKWNRLVGKNISSHSYPKSIKMEKNGQNKTLILMVERGSEIDIEYAKKEIIDKVNSYFGYELINEIRLRSSKTQIKKNKNNLIKFSKNYKEEIDKIKSKNIRNSLNKLEDTIKNA